MKTIQKSKFKPKAFEYLRLVEGGESIIITDHGRPVAKIIPYSTDRSQLVGCLEGALVEFKEPLEPVGDGDWELLT